LAFALSIVGAGCSSESGDVGSDGAEVEQFGEAVVELTRAPGDAQCLRITAVGRRTTVRDLELSAGSKTTFLLDRLPVGQVSFSAEAFDSTCKKVKTSSVPSWVSDPVVAQVSVQTRAKVVLNMYQNGRADVSVDFPVDAPLKIATYNASLNRSAEGQLISDLSDPSSAQPRVIAEIIQRNNPDVVLINEFDYDAAGSAADLFRDNFLEVSQNGAEPVFYPYVYLAPSNTGISSGFDLNNNGTAVTTPGAPGYGDDSLGFGAFPGQFGMVLYSKLPIDTGAVRTFQTFLWKDMPGALLPDDASTPAPNDFYSAEELDVFRLSSKSHWDVPVKIGDQTLHILASHPTPPVFDGPEDRNGRRNHDEIRFWADYVTPGKGEYIYDDEGVLGGLPLGESFVLLGDMNSDPFDGDSIPGAAQQLLDNPRFNASNPPKSEGAVQAAMLQGGANATHKGDPKFDTADFADGTPGNLRVDYALPSSDIIIKDSGVFWPLNTDPLFPLVGVFPFPSSDHKLVYVSIELPPPPTAAFSLNLLHASDQEAGIAATDDAPRFSAVLASLTAEAPSRTLKLTNGDVWLPGVFYNAGGDPAFASVPTVAAPSAGRADIAMINEMGFHAASFGNHEFDNGPREIRNILLGGGGWSGAKFPYLSTNLDFAPSSDLASLVVANDQVSDLSMPSSGFNNKITGSVIFVVDGQRIGVVGATTPLLPSISSPLPVVTKPSDAVDYAALAAIIQERVNAVLAKNVNKVILSAHMQQFDIELNQLAPRLSGVDVILAGGNHSVWGDDDDVLYGSDTRVQKYPQWRVSKSGEPVAVVNVGANYRYVGRLLANFDAQGRLIPSLHDEAESGAYATDAAGVARLGAAGLVDPEVQTIADTVKSVVLSKDGNIFGKTQVYLNGLRISVRTEETNLGNLTADANLWLARQTDPTTLVSLKNGGGIRDSIGTVGAGATPTFEPPAANPAAGKLAGEISQLDIENSLRFNNDLALVTVTAAQLKEAIEHSVAATTATSTPGQFGQVGGLRFSYDLAQPAQVLAAAPSYAVTTPGQRIRSLEILADDGSVLDTVVSGGALQGDPARRIRLVTLGFLADGGDLYPFPRFATENAAFYNRVVLDTTAGNQGFSDVGREQYALAQYLLARFPRTGTGYALADTPRASDLRIVRL
jgi:2',3'-cyclic-nucleotide 2'-phosphodiesterase (5'-nucleotidase family)